jgi:hypothetical protein
MVSRSLIECEIKGSVVVGATSGPALCRVYVILFQSFVCTAREAERSIGLGKTQVIGRLCKEMGLLGEVSFRRRADLPADRDGQCVPIPDVSSCRSRLSFNHLIRLGDENG